MGWAGQYGHTPAHGSRSRVPGPQGPPQPQGRPWLAPPRCHHCPARPSTELLDMAGSCRLPALLPRHLSLTSPVLSPATTPGALARCGRAGRAEQRPSEHHSQTLLAPAGSPSSRPASRDITQTLQQGIPLHASVSGGQPRLPLQPANTLRQLQQRSSALGTLGTHLRQCQTRWRPLQRQGRRAGPRWFAWTGCSSAASAPPSPIPAGRCLPEEHPWSPQTPWEEHTEPGLQLEPLLRREGASSPGPERSRLGRASRHCGAASTTPC